MTIPVFFHRDEDGDALLIGPDTDDMMQALLALARDHVFRVNRLDDMLLAEQGCAWPTTSKGLRQGHSNMVYPDNELLLAGHGSCTGCAHAGACEGPRSMPRAITFGALRHTGLDALAASTHEARVRDCTHVLDDVEDDRSLTEACLRAVGLEPSSSAAHFLDMGEVGEVEVGDVERLLAAGTDLRDEDAVREVIGSASMAAIMAAGWGKREKNKWGWSGKVQAIGVRDLCFDPGLVTVNRAHARIRAGRSGKARSANAAYRREHCARCVFNCPRPPWNMDRPRPLTDDQVLGQWAPNDEARAWMAAYTLAGHCGRFVNPDTGRRNRGIGDRPVYKDGAWHMRVRRTRPGYDVIAELPLAEYWDTAVPWASGRYASEHPTLTCDDPRKLAYAHWALRALSEHTRWGETRFRVDGRSTRNDVLYIRLWDNCEHIEIGSDTQATNYGGMNYRGSSIPSENRPRFTTSYDYPFADSIWEWLNTAPDACGGRQR